MFGADWDTQGGAALLCHPGKLIQVLRTSPFSHPGWGEMMIPKLPLGQLEFMFFSKLGAPALPVLWKFGSVSDD